MRDDDCTANPDNMYENIPARRDGEPDWMPAPRHSWDEPAYPNPPCPPLPPAPPAPPADDKCADAISSLTAAINSTSQNQIIADNNNWDSGNKAIGSGASVIDASIQKAAGSAATALVQLASSLDGTLASAQQALSTSIGTAASSIQNGISAAGTALVKAAGDGALTISQAHTSDNAALQQTLTNAGAAIDTAITNGAASVTGAISAEGAAITGAIADGDTAIASAVKAGSDEVSAAIGAAATSIDGAIAAGALEVSTSIDNEAALLTKDIAQLDTDLVNAANENTAAIAAGAIGIESSVDSAAAKISTAISNGDALISDTITAAAKELSDTITAGDLEISDTIKAGDDEISTAIGNAAISIDGAIAAGSLEVSTSIDNESAALVKELGQFDKDVVDEVKQLDTDLVTAIGSETAAVTAGADEISSAISDATTNIDKAITAGALEVSTSIDNESAALVKELAQFDTDIVDGVKQLDTDLTGAISDETNAIKAGADEISAAISDETNAIKAGAEDVSTAIDNASTALDTAIGNAGTAVTGAIAAQSAAISASVGNAATNLDGAISDGSKLVSASIDAAGADIAALAGKDSGGNAGSLAAIADAINSIGLDKTLQVTEQNGRHLIGVNFSKDPGNAAYASPNDGGLYAAEGSGGGSGGGDFTGVFTKATPTVTFSGSGTQENPLSATATVSIDTSGFMTKPVYDPQRIAADAFKTDNFSGTVLKLGNGSTALYGNNSGQQWGLYFSQGTSTVSSITWNAGLHIYDGYYLDGKGLSFKSYLGSQVNANGTYQTAWQKAIFLISTDRLNIIHGGTDGGLKVYASDSLSAQGGNVLTASTSDGGLGLFVDGSSITGAGTAASPLKANVPASSSYTFSAPLAADAKNNVTLSYNTGTLYQLGDSLSVKYGAGLWSNADSVLGGSSLQVKPGQGIALDSSGAVNAAVDGTTIEINKDNQLAATGAGLMKTDGSNQTADFQTGAQVSSAVADGLTPIENNVSANAAAIAKNSAAFLHNDLSRSDGADFDAPNGHIPTIQNGVLVLAAPQGGLAGIDQTARDAAAAAQKTANGAATDASNALGTANAAQKTADSALQAVAVDNSGDVDFGKTDGTAANPLKGMVPSLSNYLTSAAAADTYATKAQIPDVSGFIKSVKTDGATVTGDGVSTPLSAPFQPDTTARTDASNAQTAADAAQKTANAAQTAADSALQKVYVDNSGDVDFGSTDGTEKNPLKGNVPSLADYLTKTDAADDYAPIASIPDVSGFMDKDGSNQTAGFIKSVKTDGATVTGDGVSTPLSAPFQPDTAARSAAAAAQAAADGKLSDVSTKNTATVSFSGDGTAASPLEATATITVPAARGRNVISCYATGSQDNAGNWLYKTAAGDITAADIAAAETVIFHNGGYMALNGSQSLSITIDGVPASSDWMTGGKISFTSDGSSQGDWMMYKAYYLQNGFPFFKWIMKPLAETPILSNNILFDGSGQTSSSDVSQQNFWQWAGQEIPLQPASIYGYPADLTSPVTTKAGSFILVDFSDYTILNEGNLWVDYKSSISILTYGTVKNIFAKKNAAGEQMFFLTLRFKAGAQYNFLTGQNIQGNGIVGYAKIYANVSSIISELPSPAAPVDSVAREEAENALSAANSKLSPADAADTYATKAMIPDVSGLMKKDGSNAPILNLPVDPKTKGVAGVYAYEGGLYYTTTPMLPDGSNQTAGFQTAAQVAGAVSSGTAGFIKTVATDGKTITGDGVKTPLSAPFQPDTTARSAAAAAQAAADSKLATVSTDGTSVTGNGTPESPLKVAVPFTSLVVKVS